MSKDFSFIGKTGGESGLQINPTSGPLIKAIEQIYSYLENQNESNIEADREEPNNKKK